MTDILYRRYGGNILGLPADEGISLLEFAFEQEQNDKLYLRWVQSLQYSMSFDDFKNQLKPATFKRDEEVFADVEKILNGVNNGNI